MSGSQGTAEKTGLSLELSVLSTAQLIHKGAQNRGSPRDDDIIYDNTDDDNDPSRSRSSSSGDSSPEHGCSSGPGINSNNNILRPKTAPAGVIPNDATPPDHIYVTKRRPRRHSNNLNSPPICIKVGRNCENPAARIVFKKLLPVEPAPGANIGLTTTIINTFGANSMLSPGNNNPRSQVIDITETRVFSNEDQAPAAIATTTDSLQAVENPIPSFKTSLSTPSPSPSPKRKQRASTSLCIFDEPSRNQMFERSQAPSPTPAQRSKTSTGATSTSWAPPKLNIWPSPNLPKPVLRNDTAQLFNPQISTIEQVSNNRTQNTRNVTQRPHTSPLQGPPIQASASEGSPLLHHTHLTSPTLGRRSPGIASLRRNPKPYRGRRHTVGVAASDDDNDMGGTRMINPGLSQTRPPTLFETPVPDLAPPPESMIPEDVGSLGQLPLSPQSPSRTPSKRKRREEEEEGNDGNIDMESSQRPVFVCSNKILNETADRLERTLSFANFETDTSNNGLQAHSLSRHIEESHPPKRAKTTMMGKTGGGLARRSNSASVAITASNSYNSSKLVNAPRLASIPVLLPPLPPPPSSPPTPSAMQPQTPQGIVIQPWQHNEMFGHSNKSGENSSDSDGVNSSTDLCRQPLPHLSQFLVPRHMSSPLWKPSTDISLSLNGSSPSSSENQASELRSQQQQENIEQTMAPPLGPYTTQQQQQQLPSNQIITHQMVQGSPSSEALVAVESDSSKAKSIVPLEKFSMDCSIEPSQLVNLPAKNKNPKYRVGLSKYAPVDSLHKYLRK